MENAMGKDAKQERKRKMDWAAGKWILANRNGNYAIPRCTYGVCNRLDTV